MIHSLRWARLVVSLARGMADAARISGSMFAGNLTGPLNITVNSR